MSWRSRLVILLELNNFPPHSLSILLLFFFLLTFTACKTRRPNQFVAAVYTQGWTCHPEIINACLTSQTAAEDGVKAVTGRAIVIWVLTFHVQRSGNRNCFRWKLLEIQSRKLSTSFIYQALTFFSLSVFVLFYLLLSWIPFWIPTLFSWSACLYLLICESADSLLHQKCLCYRYLFFFLLIFNASSHSLQVETSPCNYVFMYFTIGPVKRNDVFLLQIVWCCCTVLTFGRKISKRCRRQLHGIFRYLFSSDISLRTTFPTPPHHYV